MNWLNLISIAIAHRADIAAGVGIAKKLAPDVLKFVKAITPVVHELVGDAPAGATQADKVEHVVMKLGHPPLSDEDRDRFYQGA